MTGSATPAVHTHSSGPNSRDQASFGELASQLSEQISRLVRDELALAQVEAKTKAKSLGLGFGMFGAAGVMALFGGGAFVAAAVLGLATVMSAWVAALIVGGALFVVAGMAALLGKKGLQRATPPIPTEAIQSAKQDVATLRQAVHR